MALTLDVIEPNSDRNGIGLILVSSGSWISKKSDNLEEEEKRRKYDHWMQGLIKGGFTLFVVRHGSSPKYFVPEMTPDILRSVRFVRAKYEEFGRPVKLIVQPGGGHSSWPGIMDQYPIVWDWFQMHLKKLDKK